VISLDYRDKIRRKITEDKKEATPVVANTQPSSQTPTAPATPTNQAQQSAPQTSQNSNNGLKCACCGIAGCCLFIILLIIIFQILSWTGVLPVGLFSIFGSIFPGM